MILLFVFLQFLCPPVSGDISFMLVISYYAGLVAWREGSLTSLERTQRLVANLTTDEKIQLTMGIPGPYMGNTRPIPRLNIPSVNMEDGPQGVADW